jgi:hypothetical protein
MPCDIHTFGPQPGGAEVVPVDDHLHTLDGSGLRQRPSDHAYDARPDLLPLRGKIEQPEELVTEGRWRHLQSLDSRWGCDSDRYRFEVRWRVARRSPYPHSELYIAVGKVSEISDERPAGTGESRDACRFRHIRARITADLSPIDLFPVHRHRDCRRRAITLPMPTPNNNGPRSDDGARPGLVDKAGEMRGLTTSRRRRLGKCSQPPPRPSTQVTGVLDPFLPDHRGRSSPSGADHDCHVFQMRGMPSSNGTGLQAMS